MRAERLIRLLAVLQLVAAAAFVGYALYARYESSWTVIAKEQWNELRHHLVLPFPDSVLRMKGDHCLAVSGAIRLLDLHRFGGHNHLSLLVGNALQLAATVIVAALVWTDRRLDRDLKAVGLALLGYLTYWLVAIRHQGFAYVVELGLISLALVVAALGLHRIRRIEAEAPAGGRSWPAIAVVGLACLVAALSFGTGLVLWPVVLLVALILRLRPRATLGLAAVTTVGIAAFFLLARGTSTAIGHLHFEPARQLAYLAGWLGSPAGHIAASFGATAETATAVGTTAGSLVAASAVLLLAWWLFVPGERSRLDTWSLAALAFGLGCGALTALGRAAYATAEPLGSAPRYLAWVLFAWAGLALLAVRLAGQRTRKGSVSRVAVLALGLVIPALLVPSHVDSWQRHLRVKNRMLQASLGLAVGVEDDAAARQLFHSPQIVYWAARELRERGVSMFAWPEVEHLGAPLAERLDISTAERFRGRLPGKVTDLPDAGVGATRFSGWIEADERHGKPAYVVAVDAAGVVRGIGLAFEPDRGRAREGRPRLRIEGYVKRVSENAPVTFYAVLADHRTAVPVQRPGRSRRAPGRGPQRR